VVRVREWGWWKGDSERKGNDMPFSAGHVIRDTRRANERRTVLIAAVNASNFTRLIRLSLAEAVRSRSNDEREERGRERERERERETRKGKKRDKDNFAIQISATYRGLRGEEREWRFPPGGPRASPSRGGGSAGRLIKFSGNQICHSAVRF